MQGIYPENFEQKIGFDRIRESLRNKCLSTMGSEWVDEMQFLHSYEPIKNQLGETDEFCRIVREFDNFPPAIFTICGPPCKISGSKAVSSNLRNCSI